MKAGRASASAAGAHRHERLERAILEELRAIVRDDVSDPELDDVRLTAIELSPDGRLARVHFAVPRGRPRTAALRAFERATGFVRGLLAEGLDLKRTPDLRFVYESELDPGAPDGEDG